MHLLRRIENLVQIKLLKVFHTFLKRWFQGLKSKYTLKCSFEVKLIIITYLWSHCSRSADANATTEQIGFKLVCGECATSRTKWVI